MTLAFRHSAQGRRVSGTCVAKTHGNTSKPACTRVVADGLLRLRAGTGSNKLRFEGRISRTRKLKAGRYTVLFHCDEQRRQVLAPAVAQLQHHRSVGVFATRERRHSARMNIRVSAWPSSGRKVAVTGAKNAVDLAG